MSNQQAIYKVPAAIASSALVNDEKYRKMYQESVVNPEGFWREHGKRIDWIKPYSKIKQTSFDDHNLSINWFYDGTLNACVNCVDRHLAQNADRTAIIWEVTTPKNKEHSATVNYMLKCVNLPMLCAVKGCVVAMSSPCICLWCQKQPLPC